jgi:deoxyribodipyrimidine photolyase-related protein
MRGLRPRDDVAPDLGQALGGRQVLQRRVSPARAAVMAAGAAARAGTLVIVLGDQLAPQSPAFAGLDPAQATVLLVEAAAEAAHVWSHKARIALFFAAMRHRAAALTDAGFTVEYLRIGTHPHATLEAAWRDAIGRLAPERVVAVEPGDWRVLEDLQRACAASDTPLELKPDTHFLCSREDFSTWAGTKSSLRMEFFYRWMRKRMGVLMDGTEPVTGRWNFDSENRKGFGARGPGPVPAPCGFEPDAVTRQAMADVAAHFPNHPGSLATFSWPVTPDQARAALAAFIAERLPRFGVHQDAMWTGMAFGWHSLLAAALNLKLIDPRDVVAAAETAWREGRVDLPSAEGFIRQVLGWREFIRGVYWRDMPRMAQANHFGHTNALPAWYWTGETQMNCMRQVIGQTLEHGYAHHIQRLMVTGNFALLAQVLPQAVCDWYLAVYVDAVDWVERPNTMGMALFADGGRFTSKPYVASGQYIARMSNYCKGCRYDPALRSGDGACPVTVLFWRFLLEHEGTLAANPRTALMAKNAQRLDARERAAVRTTATSMLAALDRL